MRVTYHKLIRDKIPTIIAATGKRFETAVYDEVRYQRALRQKLVEEAEEVSAVSERNELMNEIADLYEVADALLVSNKIHHEEVLAVQAQRRQERGAFASRLELLWVEEAE